MACTSVLRGVLANFVATFASRSSDFDGYWLFGFLVEDLGRFEIDLLAGGEVQEGPLQGVARTLACRRFRDQLAKAGLSEERVTSASMTLTRSAESEMGHVNESDSARPAGRVRGARGPQGPRLRTAR